MDLDSLEEVIGSGKKVDRRRSNTPVPWPDEWDRRKGFDWPTEPVNLSQSIIDDTASEDDEWYEMDLPEGFEAESDPDVAGIPDNFIRESVSPDLDFPDKTYKIEDAQDSLLETETSYLTILDATLGHLELDYLRNRVTLGLFLSRRKHKSALPSTHDNTEYSRRKWVGECRRFCRLYGYEWAEYADEIVGIEGMEWQRVEEGEGWEKRTVGSGGRLKRERRDECDGGRKRRARGRHARAVCSAGSGESEDSEVDYGASDLDSH